jgi:hypothetical protein
MNLKTEDDPYHHDSQKQLGMGPHTGTSADRATQEESYVQMFTKTT